MKSKKRLSTALKYSIWILTAFGIERWCYMQTGGFRESKILSTNPPEKIWGDDEISIEKQMLIDEILNQPFSYIGKGGTSYCFASLDNNYVIKFFKTRRVEGTSFLSEIRLLPALEKYKLAYVNKQGIKHKHKRKEFLFTSLLLAEKKIPLETAIVHVQLNKNLRGNKDLTIYDKIGVRHTIPLNQTQFVIQRKATMLIPLLIRMTKENRIEEGKQVIDSLFSNLQARCNQGLHDRDPHPSINFGVIDGKVVEVDIGSFSLDERLKERIKQKEVIGSIIASVRKKLILHKSYILDAYTKEKLETLYPSSDHTQLSSRWGR